jgi:hypothetical protein
MLKPSVNRGTSIHNEPSGKPGKRAPNPWEKWKLIGSKLPLRIEDVWSILTKLHVEERVWDSAMFNLVTHSKHRGYDVVRLEVEDMARLA